jgi:KipI family sensor histidine kinase inhibitor
MRAKPSDIRLLHCGDTALVVEFGDRIDRGLSEQVLALARRLDAARLPGIIEVVPTFRSLAVHYDPIQTGAASLGGEILALVQSPGLAAATPRHITLPACYEGDLAPDLDNVAAATGLSPAEVVARHSATVYHAYMIGFLPGYAYLGDLDPALHLPRRPTPRLAVPAGSVAIATSLTAVYPFESPGGWHLIGRTPVRLFDPAWEVPALIRPGDRVRFLPVSAGEYARLAALSAAGRDPPTICEAAP